MQQQNMTENFKAAIEPPTNNRTWGQVTNEDYLQLAMQGHPGTKLPCDGCLDLFEATSPQR